MNDRVIGDFVSEFGQRCLSSVLAYPTIASPHIFQEWQKEGLRSSV